MRLSDFDYDLPPHFIAQTPLEPRDASRLLVLDRSRSDLVHLWFRDLGQCLRAGDVLIFNDTRVIPARLFARKVGTDGRVELLLLKRLGPRRWEALVGGKGLRRGARLHLDGRPDLEVVVLEEFEGARRSLEFSAPIGPELEAVGHVPLPPYIHTPLADRGRYQTVYARVSGSAAAPTAGLHFTPELLARLQAQGILMGFVTLHVGLDTFAPVTEQDPQAHRMHGEWCEVGTETARLVNAARREGRRVIAVGTTTVRTLESAWAEAGAAGGVEPMARETALFIRPGFNFHVIDGLLTNFHLPRSTLLMLVSALAGRERILAAYEQAKQMGYRFYSFGDAMLIV